MGQRNGAHSDTYAALRTSELLRSRLSASADTEESFEHSIVSRGSPLPARWLSILSRPRILRVEVYPWSSRVPGTAGASLPRHSAHSSISILDLREAALEAIWAVASGGWCERAQSKFLEENHASHRQRRGLCGERQHEFKGDRRFRAQCVMDSCSPTSL